MRKLIHEAVENAYMIRNDGKPFRMLQHVYGNYDEVEETLYAAEWLYSATNKSTTRTLIANFIASWGYELNPDNDVVENILDAIDSRPYKFLTKDFVLSLADRLRDGEVDTDVQSLNCLVVDELNQEFLRARYGGMYNSTAGNKEMVFRVSSTRFNWFNIIFEFVYNRRGSISSVTVVKDEESTGFTDAYSHHGKKMYQMPIEEFILLPGNPIVEACDLTTSVNDRLKQGFSILESININMNNRRIVERWAREKYNHFSTTGEM